MNLYNLEKLIKIEINKSRPARFWEYRHEKRLFGFIVRQSGYYCAVLDKCYGEEIPENHQIENGKLCEKPNVRLMFEGGHSKTYYFTTYEFAESFGEETAKLGKFI